MGLFKPVQQPSPRPVREAEPDNNVLGAGWGDPDRILGFFQNLVGDVGEIGEGVGNILGAAGHDILWNTAKALNPVNDDPIDYYTDDLVKAIPGAVADDYKRRYGSLEGAAQGAYEDPLALAGDIMTVLTLGGYSAVKGAQVSQKAAQASGKVAKAGSLTERILNPGTRKVVAGTGMERPVIDDIPRALNPAKRVFQDAVYKNILTKDVSSLRKQLADLSPEDPEFATIQMTLKAAEQTSGRILRPIASKSLSRRIAQRDIGGHGYRFTHLRDEHLQKLSEVFEGRPADEVRAFYKKAQGLEPVPGTRLTLPEISSAIATPDLLKSPRAIKAAETIRPLIEKLDTIDPTERVYAERVIEHLGEALTDTGDDAAQMIDEARLLNFTNEGSELPFKVIFERAYVPLRQMHGARWDPAAKDFVGGPDALQLDDARRASGAKAPVYFPHIRNERISDYLMPWSLYRMRQKAQPAGVKKNKGKLFEKDAQQQRDAYIKDPYTAYAQRASAHLKKLETISYLDDLIPRFGRPITSMDELAPGEKLVNLDGTKASLYRAIDIDDLLEDGLEKGAKTEQALADAIAKAYAVPDDINAHSLYAVPEVVARRIQDAAKSYSGGIVGKVFFDKPTEVWRNLVLTLSPRFLTNQLYGNITFLKLQGGKLARVLRQVEPEYRRRMKEAIGEENLPGVDFGLYNKATNRSTNLGSLRDTATGQALESIGKSAPVKVASHSTDFLKNLFQGMENAFRRESFLTGKEKAMARQNIKRTGRGFYASKKRLEHIAKNGASETVAKEAMDHLHKAFGDYEAMSPFERKVVRRYFAPFYGFYRHSARLLLMMPFDHPLKAAALEKLAGLDEEFAEDVGEHPEYAHFPVGAGNQPGETRFWMSRGSNPLSGISETLQGVLTDDAETESATSLLHPFLKAFIEEQTGRDLFTGRPFTSPEAHRPYGSDRAYDRNQNPVDVDPSLTEHLLRMVPQVELARDIVGGGEQYSATGEVIRNPDGSPKYPTDPFQEILKFLGISTTDVNLPEYQERLNRERAAAQDYFSNNP